MKRPLASAGKLGAVVVIILFALALPSSIHVFALSNSVSSQPTPFIVNHVKTVKCADCRSGYTDIGPNGSVQFVGTSFIVPSVTCNSNSALPQIVQISAAIDGAITQVDPKVQAGVEVFCAVGSTSPTYTAYWGDAIDGTGGVATWTVSPGDIIIAAVEWMPTTPTASFGFNLDDVTTGMMSTFTGSAVGAQLDKAGCLVTMTSSTSLALANFGKIKIGEHYTGVTDSCWANISGTYGPIGSFAAPVVLYKYEIYDSTLTTLLAKPSALAADHASFTVRFVAAGP
jgi:Peptidase A4 family